MFLRVLFTLVSSTQTHSDSEFDCNLEILPGKPPVQSEMLSLVQGVVCNPRRCITKTLLATLRIIQPYDFRVSGFLAKQQGGVQGGNYGRV